MSEELDPAAIANAIALLLDKIDKIDKRVRNIEARFGRLERELMEDEDA